MSDYAFDAEFAEMIELLPTVNDVFHDPDKVIASRGEMEQWFSAAEPNPNVTWDDRMIAGPDGEVRVRVYTPVAASEERRPGLLYIHGGGFITGSIEMMHGGCLSYCDQVGVVIVSVGYRLAPENPYPAGLEDCYAGLTWFAENADELEVDVERIGVGGGSAGGGLSAALALLSRDRGGPSLCFQFLMIPELDDRLDTPSMLRFDDTPLWNRPNAVWSWTYYLGDLYGSSEVPYTAAPARCEDLSGLPPAYVSTMEFDPLRDEGIIYAMRLMEAGVNVELHSYPGTFHGSALISHAEVSKRESAEAIVALRNGLRKR